MERVRTIGKGGLGIVSLYQGQDGRQYAVKQMLYQWNNDYYERFKKEIAIMVNLAHKNIVKVLNYDYDITTRNPWYVMDYFRDGSLRDKLLDLKSKGQIYSLAGASGIIYYLADALNHAHQKGIIHRDLKPENILFNGKEPLIADWGIGKFIHNESLVLTNGGIGTKAYCPPEQWNEGISDQRSDIYSLGLMYRELITGSLIGQITDERANYIINKMTFQSPADRYQSMDKVMAEISSLNVISLNNPMGDFWNGAVKIGLTIGVVYLLAKLLGD